MEITLHFPADIDKEKAQSVATMVENVLREQGEFALVRIPYSFPKALIPQALLRLRAILDELAATDQNKEGVIT